MDNYFYERQRAKILPDGSIKILAWKQVIKKNNLTPETKAEHKAAREHIKIGRAHV